MNLQSNESRNILQYLSDDDILNYDEALQELLMKKNLQQIKKQHPYPIHYTEKSGYFTEVDDDKAPYGKRKIRRCSEESLWDALMKWYLEKNKISFESVYKKWLSWRRTPKNASTIQRIEREWKAYYCNEPLSRKLMETSIDNITTLMLWEWAEAMLKKYYPVNKKKFSRMFSIVNQCFEYASDEDIALVHENVWQRARKKINKDLIIQEQLPSDDEQVFMDDQRRMIKEMVYDDLKKYPQTSSSAGLQVLFLFETGLRIGECCGLKFSDVKDNWLYVQRQADNQGVREWTKSKAGYRSIPLTTEAQKILQDVKQFNTEHGYDAEWIFQSDNPAFDYRLGYNAADKKLRKLCARLGTSNKSPHKCRKTCISTLLDNPNVNDRTVQRFAGHTDIATTYRFYNFERKSKEEQARAIDEALSLG